MIHDFEPTKTEKEMLSHVRDIEVNRKQSELGNIISGAILDGQNQIHDLYKEKATVQEVEYRMRRAYTYWMNKLHQELQKDRETLLSEVYKELEPFSPDYYDTTPTEDERIANRYTRAMLDKLQTIIDRYQSELDQPLPVNK